MSGARGVTNLAGFLSTIVLARLLVPADFGLVALASTMLAILAAVTDLSVGSALIHHKDPTEAHYRSAWTLGLARGVLVASATCLIAWPMSLLYAEPRLDEVMYALSVTALATGMTNPRLIMMQRKLIFWQSFVLNASNSGVMVIVSIGLALAYQSYWALVAGAVAGQVAGTAVSYLLFPYLPRFSLKHAREILSFSIWLTLERVVSTANFRFDHLLVGGFLGRGALGLYTVGTNLATTPSRELVRPLTHTLFPALSLLNDDLERQRRGYQRAQTTVTAIALPAGIGFALIADPLVRLAMGEKWEAAIPVVQIVSTFYAFATLGSLVGSLAPARGATRLLFRRSLQLFLLRLPLVVAGMYLWGLMGVLAGSAIAGVAGILINMAMVERLIRLTIWEQFRANLRCILAAASMALAVWLARSALPPPDDAFDLAAAIVISVLVGVTVYLGASWLLWRAGGRPPGPEAEAIDVAAHLRMRLRNWLAGAA